MNAYDSSPLSLTFNDGGKVYFAISWGSIFTTYYPEWNHPDKEHFISLIKTFLEREGYVVTLPGKGDK